MRPIRLITFDALHTIITPRRPIHVQYSQVFSPYVGHLDPQRIKQSFRVALKDVQKEHPSYDKGAENWWRDVIRRTATGAGADEKALDTHLTDIAKKLMTRFSSREGYKAFDDAIPTIRHLESRMSIKTAVISNGDGRIRAVLTDLGFPSSLDPVILSEEEGFEKPSQDIFQKTLDIINRAADSSQGMIRPSQCLHVGDELISDYHGALDAGWHALLLRRTGTEGEHEHKEAEENLKQVKVIHNLNGIIEWVQKEKT